jgi:citrate lyase gamma subunit
MTNFERETIENIMPDSAYRKARESLKKYGVDLKSFIGTYTEEEMEKDIKYVKRRELDFQKQATPEKKELRKISTVLEAIINEQVEMAEWFGDNVYTLPSSRYDDIANGVDTIVEFDTREEKPPRLALAIDVALGSEIDEKFDDIKEEIEEGVLSEVKYFQSQVNPDDKGKLEKIPRVVVALGKKRTLDLTNLWLQGDNNALAKHLAQFHILAQVRTQLAIFKKFATEIDKPELAIIYQRDFDILTNIITNKAAMVSDINELQRSLAGDESLAAIERNLRKFNVKSLSTEINIRQQKRQQGQKEKRRKQRIFRRLKIKSGS